jgi:hypothetical protein
MAGVWRPAGCSRLRIPGGDPTAVPFGHLNIHQNQIEVGVGQKSLLAIGSGGAALLLQKTLSKSEAARILGGLLSFRRSGRRRQWKRSFARRASEVRESNQGEGIPVQCGGKRRRGVKRPYKNVAGRQVEA